MTFTSDISLRRLFISVKSAIIWWTYCHDIVNRHRKWENLYIIYPIYVYAKYIPTAWEKCLIVEVSCLFYWYLWYIYAVYYIKGLKYWVTQNEFLLVFLLVLMCASSDIWPSWTVHLQQKIPSRDSNAETYWRVYDVAVAPSESPKRHMKEWIMARTSSMFGHGVFTLRKWDGCPSTNKQRIIRKDSLWNCAWASWGCSQACVDAAAGTESSIATAPLCIVHTVQHWRLYILMRVSK